MDLPTLKVGEVCEDAAVKNHISRRLSETNIIRLQSFEDDFEFIGNMGEMSLQIGNAVPPKLAQASGKVMRAFMQEYLDGDLQNRIAADH